MDGQRGGAEQRRTPREGTADKDVRTRATLADGSVLEGIVEDISLGGAKISGATAGLNTGEEIQLVFLFPSNERVGYRCQVRHVDPAGGFFGVEFRSEPQPIEVRDPE